MDFVSTSKKGKELIESYPSYQKWLFNQGFKQVTDRRMKPKVTIDGKTCPKCSAEVWDNREKIKSGDFGKKSPHFSCKEKDSCGWAVWGEQYEIQNG